MANQQGPTVGQRHLPAMRVATQCDVEGLLADVKQA